MENVTVYKLPRRPKPKLLLPPLYCRKYRRFAPKPSPNLRMEVSDPANILLLIESLNDTASAGLEAKINAYLQTEVEAETVLMITFLPKSEEAVVKAVGDKQLEAQHRITVSKTVVDIIAEKAESEIDDDNLHPEIKSIVHAVLNAESEIIYTVPIIDSRTGKQNSETTPILICVINTKTEFDRISKYVRETFRFCLPIVLNTAFGEEENRLKNQCLSLLQIAKKLFSSLGNLDDLLRHIMGEARKLTNAERCSLFLLDPDNMYLVAKVFDEGAVSDASKVMRISKDQGIAGHVVATGKLLNIKNAYRHPLFYKGVDEATGFRTRNILCFPIKDEKGIIGVAQLCNKKTGSFSTFDEQASMAFSIYCGLSIMHSMVYKKIEDAQKRSQLSSELMLYHMKVGFKDVTAVSLCPRLHDYIGFDDLTFSPREIYFKETPCYVLKMFIELDMLKKFSIKRDKLVRFILHVQKGYRTTPYHNWAHAFTVIHFVYLIIKNAKLIEEGYISDLEALSLLIGSLCHDIDHRGTTNSFQLQTDNVLARLYSSEGSVMERHHLSQTLCILNSDNCNFLENMDNACYTRVIDLLRDNILATDLAIHLKILPKMGAMVANGYNSEEPEHKHLLLSMLMTCADLSDQTKQWRITRGVAVLIYDEFFKQGDLEKQLGKKPETMMDREKANIPELQIHFLQHICLPVFELLCGLFPTTDILLQNVKTNIRFWETSRPIFDKFMEEGKTSFDILKDLSFETEVEDKVMEDENQAEEEGEEEEQEEEKANEEGSIISET